MVKEYTVYSLLGWEIQKTKDQNWTRLCEIYQGHGLSSNTEHAYSQRMERVGGGLQPCDTDEYMYYLLSTECKDNRIEHGTDEIYNNPLFDG